MKTTISSFNFRSLTSVGILALVLLLSFPLRVFAADPPGIPEGWSENYIYVNGIRVHYYQAVPAPDKPVIVMVHGVTDNGLCWTTLSLELQKDYNIYMLDTRGHGLSDPFTSSDDGETLVKDVVGFVKAMNLENPILVGHSMGAATVMRVGAEYTDLAKAIVMLDPFVSRPPGSGARPTNSPARSNQESNKQKETESKKISINMFGDPETLVKQNNYSFDELVELGKKQSPKWDLMDIQYWALSKKQYHGAYTAEQQQAMSGTMRTEDALQKIQVPSIILKADTNAEGKKANEDAVAGLDNVKLMHLEGTGHNLHHDDLDATVKEINGFLSNLN
ncbi:alpha/beta hydrolase [Algoriphagus sp. D3-2-R+10]|uniref:alpha/beta fold hydrolase n=1 Tax=Algoriphagus aurantiacus TaxID=3103948 RepID=UPI002B3D1356|nr:alpha/beta hydrolase [Algoriphagus sp. D3-2-R+10]MEB2774671.1 alpha/beta hydrolase [Algoriphagus sp. D3-2-R+10]